MAKSRKTLAKKITKRASKKKQAKKPAKKIRAIELQKAMRLYQLAIAVAEKSERMNSLNVENAIARVEGMRGMMIAAIERLENKVADFERMIRGLPPDQGVNPSVGPLAAIRRGCSG